MMYIQLFLSFFQISLFSFGGGYAALPLIQGQVVNVHHWLSMTEFTDLITISQMTPGPIAVNSATFVGTRIAGMQATVVQYNASLNSARARLAVLTGIQAERYSPVPGGLAVEPDSLNRIDYSLITTVMAAQNMERSARYGVETAKSQHWPTLSLKGGRTRYESDNRSYWDDQIQLNIDAPLYQGGAVSARVRQAEGARAMASSQVDQARFDVLQKASVAQADWTGARGRMEAGKQQLENALRARDVYKNEYTLSKRSINDLLSVEQDVWQATSAKIIAEYDGWSSAINYASAVDNLMPLIGIEKNAAAKLPDLS